MSANNQTLIKLHNGKYLVFSNVMAESWSDDNELEAKLARFECSTRDEATEKASLVETTEYGIIYDVLHKDGASVKIV